MTMRFVRFFRKAIRCRQRVLPWRLLCVALCSTLGVVDAQEYQNLIESQPQTVIPTTSGFFSCRNSDPDNEHHL